MLVGYARVSTPEQSLNLQQDALARAGCERMFTDVASGAQAERPGLSAALTFLRLNYGERWRQGEAVATGFVESTVNAVVSKRMVKKQQMQWTPKGSHLLLQVRIRVLNGELDDLFRECYPSFRTPPIETRTAAA